MNDHSLKKKLFSGFFWKFAERIFAQGISFVVSVVLSRLLLPEEFGIVALVMIFINIANVFVVSGISTALVQNKDADNIDFSTNFYCSLTVSLAVYAILFAAAPYIARFYDMPDLTLVIRIFTLRIPLSTFNAIQHAYVERHMQFRKFFFSTLFGTVFSGIVGIVMALYGFGVWALIAQYFTNTIVDTIVLFFTVPWKPRLQFSAASAKRMMGFGWKVLAADLSGTVFDQLRSLLVGKVYTTADLAFYNKGKNLPDLIANNVKSTVMTVLFPAISNINDDRQRVKELTRRSLSVMAYVLFPALFGMAAAARPLITVLFTEVWEESVPFVQLLSVSAALGLLGSISLQTMKALGRSDILLLLEFIKKPVYLILLIVGIKISVLAVAVTMLVYTVYGGLVNAYQLKKLIGYTYSEQLKDLISPMLFTALMCGAVILISLLPIPDLPMLIMQVVLGAAVYVGISYITKDVNFTALCRVVKEKRSKNGPQEDL